ncbi:cilia- and flagella-associated protein 53 [Tiliqua scincoides]|uniref:cilia- and flagella-associated protein 53 n=1 Tax=Tiliqua scincoides TaxID=71010 RepID=UPI003462E323
MINDQGRLIREVTGPKPHSLAIKATYPKPSAAKKEILAWRAQDKIRRDAALYVKSHTLGRWMNEMEQRSDRRQLDRFVKRKVDAEMQAYLAEEEERKERLRDLLEAEEKGYIAEMESLHETTEDRQNKMRVRAKLLRKQREEASQKLVAEKREQQFRQTCEQLRTQWSKKHLMEVCEDRLAQLALKEELKKQKAREEATFAALWEEDRLAKEKREDAEAQQRLRRNKDTLAMLNTQRAVAEAQREEERRLKAEEAKLMEEERELMKLENERAELERQQKLRECRDTLLDSIKEKMRRLNEAKQEELALDMKILDHALQEALEDTEGQRQRKKEILQEQQRYRAYLAQQKEEEKRQEKEVDKLRKEEIEKMWARRSENERAMKEARSRLLKEVLDTRRLQIEEKLQRNALEQEALLRDRELLNAAIQEYNRLEEEKYARRLRQTKEYREDLQAQIDHLKQARNMEKEEEAREYAAALEAERLFQQKMADVLSRPYMKLINLHPLRRQLACDSQS